MAILNQFSFAGGMNYFAEEASLGENEYVKLFNGRNRGNGIFPVKKAVKQTAPRGKMQGVYAAGNIILLFVTGKAYYRVIGTHTDFQFIPNFLMDPTVDFIYGDFVPAASAAYQRKIASSGINKDIEVIFDANLTASKACFVAQDGVNQPFIIDANGVASVAKTFAQWTETEPEYVPIGKQTSYIGSKLYVVSPDGKSIYHSVSGKPLDFMVNVTSAGAAGGDASTVSFAVDFNEITCITKLNSPAFLVGNRRFVYLLTPDYSQERKVFGEPTYAQQALEVGVMNQQSANFSVNGDVTLIDADGIKSLNAVQQVGVEGNNSIFSLTASKFFEDGVQKIIQDVCATVSYDNYVLFAVNSIFGYGILVYDTLLEKFVSFDTPIGKAIKQFAQTFDGTVRHLYAITEDSLYELYASSERATCVLQTRAFLDNTDNSRLASHKPRIANAAFRSTSLTEADVSLYTVIDGSVSQEIIEKSLEAAGGGINVFGTPVPNPTTSTIQRLTFQSRDTVSGYRLSYILRWSSDATLLHFQGISDSITSNQSAQQQAKNFE